MQIVTNEQIYDRWEQVPEALKEAFFSVDNGEIVWKACEDAGLPEEVIDNVLIVMGNVLLGFTHINDLAKELQSIPDMDQKAIDPIIFQIDKRVFDPVKAEILKLRATVAGDGPSIVAQEAATPMRAEVATKVTVPMADAPAMISTEHGPAIAPAAPETAVEIRKVRIEGDMQRESAPAPIGGAPAPISAAPAPMAAPTIIHSEADLVPVAQKKRALSSFGGMFGFRSGEATKRSEPAVAAQVSMIEGLGRKPEDVARTAQQPVKVVHYTSAKAPEDIFAQQPTQQEQPMPTAFVPVTKQQHVVDFEPKVVDLATSKPLEEAGMAPTTPMPQVSSVTAPVPPMPEENRPIAPMPKVPEAIVMKTPQRVEAVAIQAPPVKEPQLAEIPVRDDIVDLRMLERVNQDQPKK